MGKGSSSGGQVYDYYGSIAGVVCSGPVDELVAILADGKVVWPTSKQWEDGKTYAEDDLVIYSGRAWTCLVAHTAAADPPPTANWEEYTVLRRPGLFTYSANPFPITVEGYGQAYLYWGTHDQTLDAVSEKILSDNGHPSYRNQVVLVLKDFLFGREKVSAPNIEVVVRRKPKQTILTGVNDLDSDGQANPLAAAMELLTDPIFGLGSATMRINSTSWQTLSSALAVLSDQAYVSPVVDRPQAARAILAELLAYYDGWFRSDITGSVEAGRFLHNEAPPTFTAANTIDYHDLVEEIAFTSAGWTKTTSETAVKFSDRFRAFKDNCIVGKSAYNLQVVGEPRRTSIDRPWITRSEQAAGYAAEWCKINALPAVEGTLVIRAEKATSIKPGELFQLTHDALATSLVCRCIEKEYPAPPSGVVRVRFISERGLAPIPYSPTPAQDWGTAYPTPEDIDHYTVIQLPETLTGQDSTLTVLAARKSAVTQGFRCWLQAEDATLFYEIGQQRLFGAVGLLTQSYASSLPADGTNPPDDTSEWLRVHMDSHIQAVDLEKVTEDQTQDAIEDANLLAILVSASDSTVFEICTVIAARIVSGDYYLQVRRGRFGTSKRSWSTSDVCWIIPRRSIMAYYQGQFPNYIENGDAVTLRFQSFNPGGEADLATCPDVAYTFDDPSAPSVAFTSITKNGSAWSSFTDILASTDSIQIGFTATSPLGLLTGASLVARLGATETVLWSGTWTARASQICTPTAFSLGNGSWKVFAVALDSTGRRVETQLYPVGGGTAVTIEVNDSPGALTSTPSASPVGGAYPSFPKTVTLTCSTAASTIYYQLVTLGAAAGGSWTTYSTPISVSSNKTLHCYSSASGKSDSAVITEHYAFEPSEEQPRGTQPR